MAVKFKRFEVEVKQENGEIKKEAILIDQTVESLLSVGMKAASKADNTWRDNFEAIVTAFWPKYEPAPGDKASVIRATLRESSEFQKLEGVLQQEHGDAERLARAYEKLGKEAKGSEAADDAKLIVDGLREKIRLVAYRQATTIIGYYADAHGADTTGQSKEPKGARTLIEEAIEDWAAKVESKRKPYDLPAERALLSAACSALRSVLNESLAKLADQLQSKVAQPISRPERAAGPVKVLSAEEVKEVIAE